MSLTKVTNSMILGAVANVLDYGADPTGVADSTVAIQAAITTGNSVFIPAGSYKTTAALTPVSNQTIFGAGQNLTFIKASVAGQNGFTVLNKSFVDLRDMTVQNTASTPTGDGIYIQGGGNCFVTQVVVISFFRGFNLKSTGSLQINRCYSTSNISHGFLLNTDGTTPTVGVWIRDCYSTANTGNGIAVVGLVTGIYLDTLELSINTANGIEFIVDGSGAPSDFLCTKVVCDTNGQSGFIINSGVNQCYFNNCWSSNRGSNYNFYSAGTEIQIVGGFFYNCNGNGINLLGAYNSVIGASVHNAGINTANTFDGIYANASYPIITGCTIYSGNSGATDKTRYAINLGSSVINGAITGNNVVGVFGSPKINVGTTDSATLQNIANNVGYSSPVYSGTTPWISGAGSPEGVVTAIVGALYSRTDGSTSTTLYVKTSGTGNTGWTAK
jgi:hypothetical protein